MQQLEVVRYMPGQYFKPHCDSIDGLMSRAGYDDSTRLATLITYLNSVDEGGETFFSRLDLKVKPRQGTALAAARLGAASAAAGAARTGARHCAPSALTC